MKYAFAIAIAFVTIAAPASAQTAAQLNAQELARIQSGGPGDAPAAMPVNMAPPPMASPRGCPPGMRWVPAGYAKKGKWRPAGCVRR